MFVWGVQSKKVIYLIFLRDKGYLYANGMTLRKGSDVGERGQLKNMSLRKQKGMGSSA